MRPPVTHTSFQLIDAALAAGRINLETALVYKVFSEMGDCRLPHEFEGDDTSPPDDDILGDLRTQFSTLSPDTQRTLEPFLKRPDAHGSWVELGTNCVNQSLLNVVGVLDDTPVEWGVLGTTNGKALVHFQRRFPNDLDLAISIRFEVDSLWPRLTGFFGREPKSDAELTDDPRLDIYVGPLAEPTVGFYGQLGCGDSAGYIFINNAQTSVGPLRQILVRFVTKAILSSYKGNVCGEYHWLMQATSTWAQHYIYPESFDRFGAADFLRDPSLPLETDQGRHSSGAYLFLLFLQHGLNDAPLIRTFWENSSQPDSLANIDSVLAAHGGFRAVWPKFVRYNWNREPVDDYHRWDSMPTPFSLAAPISAEPEKDFDAYSFEQIAKPKTPLRHLSAQYFRFEPTLPDDSVVILNGWTYQAEKNVVVVGELSALLYTSLPLDSKPDTIHVEALAEINGQWRQYVDSNDWSNKGFLTFCRDEASEHLEEVVVIVSNSEFHNRNADYKPSQLPLVEFSTNFACKGWEEGSARSVGTWAPNGGVTTQNVDNLKWHRASADADTTQYYNGSAILGFSFVPEGTIQWSTQTPSDCSASPTSGSFDAATNQAKLQTFSLAPIGSTLYQKYTGKGSGPQQPFTLTCHGKPAPAPPPLFPWLLLLDENMKLPEVEDAGRELSGKGGRFPIEFFWHFTAEKSD